MPVIDIRQEKEQLRSKYKQIRKSFSSQEKQKSDEKIKRKLTQLWAYRDEELILPYVSLPSEVDTKQLIVEALKDGKKVAVPRCVENTRNMDFYLINSINDLEIGSFGVLEPKVDKCDKLEEIKDGLCIVPALAFDKRGYRLGYGKGYYDRFLSSFEGKIVGVCYSSCVCERLPNGKYDRMVSSIVTEKNVISTVK